jgi:hypothetical protein
MPYEVGRVPVNFDINSRIMVVVRASSGVARWDAMGWDGHQWAAMCGDRAALILPKTEQEGGWLNSLSAMEGHDHPLKN